MSQMQLPKWGDLNTYERHKLLGELIDSMIYSGEAVFHLRAKVEQFRLMGFYLKTKNNDTKNIRRF